MTRPAACLTAGVIVFLAWAAQAQEQGEIEEGRDGWVERIDKVVEVDPGGTIELSADIGGIEVETWSRKAVRVLVEKEADVFTEQEARRVFEDMQVEISQAGKDIQVEARSNRGRGMRSLQVRFWLTVPEQFSVTLETAAGGIEVADLEGHVNAHTSGGGIEVGYIKNGSVDISTSGGGLSIEGIENGDGKAETSGGGIDVGDVTGNLVIDTSGGGIRIGEVGGTLVAETRGGGIDIEAGGINVLATTGGGGINVGEASGDVVVETSGGGIEVGPTNGSIKAETRGGGISIGKTRGPVVAEAAGGGIEVDGSGGPVVVETSGGGIDVENAGGYIEARTRGGGITAELAVADPDVDTHCTLETSGGNVTIHLPADLQATVDADLRISGFPRRDYVITSDFPLEIKGEGTSRVTASGTINGGGDLIRLRTTNGDIEIKKR